MTRLPWPDSLAMHLAALVRARGEASCREAEQLRAAVTRHALLAYTLCIRGQPPFYFFYTLIYNLHIVITLYVVSCRDILAAAAALPLAVLAGPVRAGVRGRGGEAGPGGRLVEAAGLERGAAHGEGGPLQIRQGRPCSAPPNLLLFASPLCDIFTLQTK